MRINVLVTPGKKDETVDFVLFFPFGKEHLERVVQSHVRLESRLNRKNKQTLFNQIIQNKFLFKTTARGKLGDGCKVTHVKN